MAYWILQCNPSQWRVVDFFNDGNRDTVWTIRRHRELIGAGDEFALWLSGSRGGVVALGEVTGDPTFGAVEQHQERYWTSVGGRESVRWTVPVHFKGQFLDRRIPRERLIADQRFSDAQILRSPQSSNPFPVTSGEWDAIAELADT